MTRRTSVSNLSLLAFLATTIYAIPLANQIGDFAVPPAPTSLMGVSKANASEPAGSAETVSQADGPTEPGYAITRISPVPLKQQEARAEELKAEIDALGEYDYDDFIRLYRQTIDEAPDTLQALRAHRLLVNTYVADSFETWAAEIRDTALQAKERYPNKKISRMLTNHLTRAYEHLGQYAEVVPIYARILEGREITPDLMGGYGLSYAEALYKSGDLEAGKAWLERILDVVEPDSFTARFAKSHLEDIAKLEAASGN